MGNTRCSHTVICGKREKPWARYPTRRDSVGTPSITRGPNQTRPGLLP